MSNEMLLAALNAQIITVSIEAQITTEMAMYDRSLIQRRTILNETLNKLQLKRDQIILENR